MDATKKLKEAQLKEKNSVPKKLSPKEEADLKKKRQIFRNLHDCFAQDEVFDAEAGLSELEGMIEGKFFTLQEKTKINDLDLADNITEEKQKLLEVLGECTVAEGMDFVRALRNGIDQHKYKHLKNLTVKGLNIKLL